MRIFITTPSMNIAGGIERVVSIQVNYWACQCKYEVYIITTDNENEDSFYPLASNVRIINIEKPSHSYLKFEKFRYYKSAYRTLMNKYSPDIVFSTMHGIDVYFLPIVCKGIPIVAINHICMCHRRGDFSLHTNVLSKLRYKVLKHQLKKYSAIVALSRTDAIYLKTINSNTYYIPNPIIPVSSSEREAKPRKKQIVCVGRLDYLKGQDRLIGIWNRIFMKYPAWKLVFVGDGNSREKLQNLVQEKGLKDSVQFLGIRNDVFDILSESSIFAFTSRVESFGMAILEAFENELPVVCYDCENGPRDLVFSYFNGFLIKENDEIDFSDKVSLLIENEELRHQLAIAGKSFSDRFSVNKVMSMYDDLIKNVCAK